MLSANGKSALGSVTIWGGLASLVSGILDVVNQVSQSGQVPSSWLPWLTLVGGIATIFGRMTATKQITSVVPGA